MNAKQKKLTRQLKSITKAEPNSLRTAVANEALDYHNIEDFFSDLLEHGCISGMVGSLVYYADTHAFYDAHYSEIEDLRYEYVQSIGNPLNMKGDLKNWLAWFGFEETARLLADELGIGT